MGHQRLGDIPKTQKWQNVVAKVAGDGQGSPGALLDSDVIRDIASETLTAAEGGLLRTGNSGLETGTQLDIDSSCVPVSARGNYCFGDTEKIAPLNEKRVVLSTIRFARRTPLIRAGVNTSGTFPSI